MAKLRGRPASLTDEQIAQILELYDTGEYGYLRISKMLGITEDKARYYIKRFRLQMKDAAKSL